MKVPKALSLMLWNPTAFIVYFLGCWILFSAVFTIGDESFVYGTWPDVVEAAEGAFANLPGSLWKLVTALSIITEEITRDFIFSYRLCLFIIPFALTLSYREARSNRNGIATERKAWIWWYERQQLVEAQQGTYETPPLSEHISGGSYFISARQTVLFMFRHLILLVGHFLCWFTLLVLPILFDGSGFVRRLPEIVIPAVIFTLILSYREARSHLKGMAIGRDIWTKWYYRQRQTTAQRNIFDEPPSSESVKPYAYSGEIPKILLFMGQNPKPFIVHLTCWIFVIGLLFFTSLQPHKTPEDIMEVFDLIGTFFAQFLPWITIIVFIISYREARGNLKGIAKTQRVWMQWYHRQQATIRCADTFAEPPPSERIEADSYFTIAKKTLQFMGRNPIYLIMHVTGWFLGFILVDGGFPSFVPVLFVLVSVLVPALILQLPRGERHYKRNC